VPFPATAGNDGDDDPDRYSESHKNWDKLSLSQRRQSLMR